MAHQREAAFLSMETPPHTPRKQRSDRYPPRDAPHNLVWQPGTRLRVNGLADSSVQLSRALERGSIPDIQKILDSEPDAVWMPVFIPHMEPPVCAAILLQCDLSVIDFLLAQGAKVTMVNSRGQNPLSVLASCSFVPTDQSEYKQKENWVLKVAVQLLQAGCDITEKDSRGINPEQLAIANGWSKLADIIQEWKDYKNGLMLRRFSQKALQSQQEGCLGCFQKVPFSLLSNMFDLVAVRNPAQLID